MILISRFVIKENRMKSIIPVFLLAFIFSFVGANAQQTHFIYIQTGNKQPFYLKLGKAVYSSSFSGYLIISKLEDSTYNFLVGFPKSEWPQQNFSCTVDKDQGFLLKNFDDKGWGLFNLQTLEVTMANNPIKDKNIVREERTDSFSNMLSAVVNDPTIKEKEIVKPEVKQDTIASKQNETASPTIPAENIKPIPKSTVTQLLNKTNADGTELVYLDNNDNAQDTIRIFIPADKVVIDTQQNTNAAIVALEPVKQETKNQDKKFIDMELPASNSNTKQDSNINTEKIQQVSATTNEKTVVTNNGCKDFASNEDFLRLRKKMAAEEADDDMISTAKKIFKTKCFTTSQVKNLGFLFLSDKGRYKFFDMAYSYVSDPENFGSLASQLTDIYFLNRFKAMIKQ
jgi:hypothetical protein